MAFEVYCQWRRSVTVTCTCSYDKWSVIWNQYSWLSREMSLFMNVSTRFHSTVTTVYRYVMGMLCSDYVAIRISQLLCIQSWSLYCVCIYHSWSETFSVLCIGMCQCCFTITARISLHNTYGKVKYRKLCRNMYMCCDGTESLSTVLEADMPFMNDRRRQ